MKNLCLISAISLCLFACGGENLKVESPAVHTNVISSSQIILPNKTTVPIPSVGATTPTLPIYPANNTAQSSQLTVVAQDLLGKPLANIDIQLDQSISKKTNQQGQVTFDNVVLGKHDIHFLSPTHEWVSLYQTNNKNILWKLPAREDSYLQFQGRLSYFDPAQQGHHLELVFLHPNEKRVLGRSSCYPSPPSFRCFGVLNGIATDSYTELDILAVERDSQQRIINSTQIAYRFLYYGQSINQLSLAYAHDISFPMQTTQHHLLKIQNVTAISGSIPTLIEASAFAPGGYGMILDMQSLWPNDLYASLQPDKLWAIAMASTNDGGFWSIIQKTQPSSTITNVASTLNSSLSLKGQTLAKTEQGILKLSPTLDQQSLQQLIIRNQNNTRALWRLYFSTQQQQLTLPKVVNTTLQNPLQAQSQYLMQQQLWRMDTLAYDQALIHMGNPYGLSLHQSIEIISTGSKALIFN